MSVTVIKKITLVKKILADGSPCKKCNDVITRLEAHGQIRYINAIVTADERDENSLGMQLAAKHKVKLAPFFIVEQEETTEQDGEKVVEQQTKIYTIYYKFVKEVINKFDKN